MIGGGPTPKGSWDLMRFNFVETALVVGTLEQGGIDEIEGLRIRFNLVETIEAARQ